VLIPRSHRRSTTSSPLPAPSDWITGCRSCESASSRAGSSTSRSSRRGRR
jgi:hypothetical protein